MERYVWYACYGSNLNYDRFICYIKGGKPKGAKRKNRGCMSNKKTPKRTDSFAIPYPLYFAKNSSNWYGSGVAFIGLTKDSKVKTLSKLYLITKDQFEELFVQENGEKYEKMYEKIPLSLSFEEIMQKRSKVIWNSSWYGNIIYLGLGPGEIPIFTTTSSKNERPISPPNEKYLFHIIMGLRTKPYNLLEDKIVEYLHEKIGIQEKYKKEDLVKIVQHCK